MESFEDIMDKYNKPKTAPTHARPLPKGNSFYAKAKRSEYIEKNL